MHLSVCEYTLHISKMERTRIDRYIYSEMIRLETKNYLIHLKLLGDRLLNNHS